MSKRPEDGAPKSDSGSSPPIPVLTKKYAALLDEFYGDASRKNWSPFNGVERATLRIFADWLDARPATEPKCATCGTMFLRIGEGYAPVCTCHAEATVQVEPPAPRVCPDSADGNHVLKQDGPFSVVYCDACGMNRGYRTQEPPVNRSGDV